MRTRGKQGRIDDSHLHRTAYKNPVQPMKRWLYGILCVVFVGMTRQGYPFL